MHRVTWGRDKVDLRAGVGTGPGPCPGKFSVPGTESRNSLVPGTAPQSWVPESIVPQMWVPVPVPDPGFFHFESRSRSRIPDFLILRPGPSPGERYLKQGGKYYWIRDTAGPSPKSRKFWIWVPVSVPDFKMSPGTGTAGSRGPCPECRPLFKGSHAKIGDPQGTKKSQKVPVGGKI